MLEAAGEMTRVADRVEPRGEQAAVWARLSGRQAALYGATVGLQAG